jgi:hypothetical protein
MSHRWDAARHHQALAANRPLLHPAPPGLVPRQRSVVAGGYTGTLRVAVMPSVTLPVTVASCSE